MKMTKESRKFLPQPQPLKILEGMELASVVFVRDYSQLCFEDPKPEQQFGFPTLSIYTPPFLTVGSDDYEWESPEFCKYIRNCIGGFVKIAKTTEKEMSLMFENGVCITISLNPEDYVGPEAAMLSSDQTFTCVW